MNLKTRVELSIEPKTQEVIERWLKMILEVWEKFLKRDERKVGDDAA